MACNCDIELIGKYYECDVRGWTPVYVFYKLYKCGLCGKETRWEVTVISEEDYKGDRYEEYEATYKE